MARQGPRDTGHTKLPQVPSIVDWSLDQHVLTCPTLEPGEYDGKDDFLAKLKEENKFYCLPLEVHQRAGLSRKSIASPVTDFKDAPLRLGYENPSLTWEAVTMRGVSQAQVRLLTK